MGNDCPGASVTSRSHDDLLSQGNVALRAYSNDPGTTHCPGVNFASVHGLTSVTVHMSFSLPHGDFERQITRCITPGNPPCRGNFSPCEQNAKVTPWQE